MMSKKGQDEGREGRGVGGNQGRMDATGFPFLLPFFAFSFPLFLFLLPADSWHIALRL